MHDETHPWRSYDKGTLPKGFHYPIGRDAIEAELLALGVTVGSLRLARPLLPVDPNYVWLLGVSLPGDADADYFGGHYPRPRSWLSVNGVPNNLHEEMREIDFVAEIRAALSWLAEAAERGNAWLASDHGYSAAFVDGAVRIQTS